MRKVWIVVANSSIARIFRAESVNSLVEQQTFIHEESHLVDKELIAEKPGRSGDHFGLARGAYQEQTPQQVKERSHFATQISKFLEKQYFDGEMERVYLIARAPFLGFLRQSLHPNVSKLIYSEIEKDLTHLRPEKMREYLPPVL